MIHRLLTFAVAALFAALQFSNPAFSQAWPSKQITLVVAAPAGTSSDMLGRVIAEAMGPKLGQNIIIENRPGASGVTAAGHVVRAEPDGHTLLLATSAAIASAPSLFKSLPYDPEKDLTPITQISELQIILVVNSKLPVTDIPSLVEYIKQQDGRFTYSSAGNASLGHISGALFAEMTGQKMIHVPFQGGAAAATAVMQGEVQMLFTPVSEALPALQSGSVKALGVASSAPIERFPDLKLISDTMPGFIIPVWQCLMAPAGTPAEIVEKIAAGAKAALTTPEVAKKLTDQGIFPIGSTPAEFKAFIPEQIERWAELVKVSGAEKQ